MPPKAKYPRETQERAKALYLAGSDNFAAIAKAVGVTAHETIRRWAKAGNWAVERKLQIESGYAGPLKTQEALERVASEQIAQLMRSPSPQPDELARWQDIVSKCRSNIRAIYEQACDAEIYVRTVEMMVQHLGSLPDDQRAAVADALEPFLEMFERAIRSGKVRPA